MHFHFVLILIMDILTQINKSITLITCFDSVDYNCLVSQQSLFLVRHNSRNADVD